MVTHLGAWDKEGELWRLAAGERTQKAQIGHLFEARVKGSCRYACPLCGPSHWNLQMYCGPPSGSQHAASQDKAILLSTCRAGGTNTSVVVQYPVFHEAAN
jgi:hypothetical protein